MKKSTFLLASCFALGSTYTMADSVSEIAESVEFSGGATAGYFYGYNQNSDNAYNFLVSDFILEASSPKDNKSDISFVAGFGNQAQVTYLAPNGNEADGDTRLRYASLTYAPINALSLEAGLLATNVGYESPSTYNNPNIILGAMWNSQPAYYPGARLNFMFADMGIYAEVSKINNAGDIRRAYAVGFLGSLGPIDFALNYFDENKGNKIIDFVIKADVPGVDLGANIDFIKADKKPAGADDDTGIAVGLYVSPQIGPVALPMRAEFIQDGDSAIYGFDSGYTFAITPTFNVSKNAYLRVELSYAKASNDIFADSDGDAKDNAVGGAFQMGYTF